MSLKYNKGRTEFAKGNIDWENDTIKMAKMATTYTPDADIHQYLSDISADRVGTDQTLANNSVIQNDTDDASDQNSDDTTESSQTLSTNKVVVYKSTGVEGTSVLISCHDIIEGTISPTDGDIDLTINVRGLFSI